VGETLRTALWTAIADDLELIIHEGTTRQIASTRTMHLGESHLIACHIPLGQVEWEGLGGDVTLFWMSGHNGQIHYLEKDMYLLETGDFDNDGQTDAVFMLTREATDTYLLAYDGLTRMLLCATSYH
jgi:hypothetical protein